MFRPISKCFNILKKEKQNKRKQKHNNNRKSQLKKRFVTDTNYIKRQLNNLTVHALWPMTGLSCRVNSRSRHWHIFFFLCFFFFFFFVLIFFSNANGFNKETKICSTCSQHGLLVYEYSPCSQPANIKCTCTKNCMKALKLTIAIIAGKSMAYSYIVLYFYNNKKSSQELVFSSFVHNSQKN